MIIIYTTCKDKKEAERIGNLMVGKKLAACANYFPINSLYLWKGKKCRDSEFALLLKTVEANFRKIDKEVREAHSYEGPCILKIKADAGREYSAWVKSASR